MLSQITCCIHMLVCHAYVFITWRIASCQRSGQTSFSSLTLTEKSLFTYDQNVAKLRFSFRSFMVKKNKRLYTTINDICYTLIFFKKKNDRSNGHRQVHTEQKKYVHLSIHSTIHMVQHKILVAHWLLPLSNSVSSISVLKF